MKKVKERKSIKKNDYYSDLWHTPNDSSSKNLRHIDTEQPRASTGTKSYRISKNDNLRISNSPSSSSRVRPPLSHVSIRKKSESSEIMKASGT